MSGLPQTRSVHSLLCCVLGSIESVLCAFVNTVLQGVTSQLFDEALKLLQDEDLLVVAGPLIRITL